jgi:hypothetical protein
LGVALLAALVFDVLLSTRFAALLQPPGERYLVDDFLLCRF